MKLLYDKEVDALYIEFKQIIDGSASTDDLSDYISINYDVDGKIAGIEILDASKYFDNLNAEEQFENEYKKNELIFA
ncbi:MAG TPA: DUF2283 domain-containing protein [Candidatus Kapabacteria bacterium]|mgnify:CR=1 FL=1|nr:DUF2283 domain-containing protein [Candidatus Kapabacteria bacterium]HPO63357.1 DUF2283 domain-containing protein [Candidatus Kapabacteria bacterium]